MQKNFIFYTLIIYSLTLIGWVRAEMNPYELAMINYRQAGLIEYFESRAVLRTETMKRRLDLETELPKVDVLAAKRFQKILMTLLTQQPKNWQALILAGNYHLYQHQNDTARWYFEQAYQLAPSSIATRLALADFYLEEYQPARALKVLEGMTGAEVALRQGEAEWQNGNYRLALGYFLNNTPLNSYLENIRIKNLYRTLLSIGENDRAQRLRLVSHNSKVLTILWQELQGWQRKFAGKDDEALKIWQQNAKLFPKYEFFQSENNWLSLQLKQKDLKITGSLNDLYLKAQALLLQGEFELAHGDLNAALKNFKLALAADPHSLLGLLKAGEVAFNQADYLAAVNFFTQGLALNSNFTPFYEKRALALTKLGRKEEAARDQLAAVKSRALESKTKLKGIINFNEQGQTVLELSGATERMVGLWLRKDQQPWQYYPWWGGAIPLEREVRQLWVLPVGTGLSGETICLKNSGLPLVKPKNLKLQFKDDKYALKLPFKARVVITKELQDQLQAVYVGNFFTDEHLLPLEVGRDTNKLLVWLENETQQRGIVELPVVIGETSVSEMICQLDSVTSSTNQREITLKLTPLEGSKVPSKMMITEGANEKESVWQPYRAEFQYRLSLGDGRKIINVKYADQAGNQGKATFEVWLDTKAPRVIRLKNSFLNPELVQIEWVTDEIVSSQLQILTIQGKWINVVTDSNRIFAQTVAFNKKILYYRLKLIDESGNQIYYPITALNKAVGERAVLKFVINEGQTKVKSRNITIRPATEVTNLRWRVSNDLKVWSAEQSATSKLHWRIGSNRGENLIYIKYFLPNNQLEMQVIAVIYNRPN